MVKAKTKKITIDTLAGMMADGFKKQEKATDEKIDDLAAITKRGFDKTSEDLEAVKNDVHFLKSDVQGIKEKVENIEKLILQQHGFQIKKLENKVGYIEEILTIDK